MPLRSEYETEDINSRDVDESLDKALPISTGKQAPGTEAPLSIHIDSYYKGFHVGTTIRMVDNSVVPTTRIVNAVEGLIARGFVPSWNVETNNAHQAPQSAIVGHPTTSTTLPTQVCGVHGTVMVMKPAGVSKTSGKAYPAFLSCPSKNADGTYCSFRPGK